MDLLCKAFKGLEDLPFDFMKTILLYILGSILITDVIARERFNLDFKPDVEDFLEKEKLLSFLKSYVNNAFIQRDEKKLFGMYRKQSSAKNEEKLLAILKGRSSLLEGQEIQSLVVLDTQKKKPVDERYSSEVVINLHLKTSDYEIGQKLVFLFYVNGGWCLKEKLNLK